MSAGQFDDAGFSALGQDRAGGDQLDRIRALIEQQIDLLRDLCRAAGDPHPHLGRNLHSLRQSSHFTAAAGPGDIAANRVDPRAHHIAAVNCIAQFNVAGASVRANIVDRGEPCLQGGPRIARAEIGGFLRPVEQGFGRIVGLEIVGEVDVDVDQSGQHPIG